MIVYKKCVDEVQNIQRSMKNDSEERKTATAAASFIIKWIHKSAVKFIKYAMLDSITVFQWDLRGMGKVRKIPGSEKNRKSEHDLNAKWSYQGTDGLGCWKSQGSHLYEGKWIYLMNHALFSVFVIKIAKTK